MMKQEQEGFYSNGKLIPFRNEEQKMRYEKDTKDILSKALDKAKDKTIKLKRPSIIFTKKPTTGTINLTERKTIVPSNKRNSLIV